MKRVVRSSFIARFIVVNTTKAEHGPEDVAVPYSIDFIAQLPTLTC
jgi:hypothetical protein